MKWCINSIKIVLGGGMLSIALLSDASTAVAQISPQETQKSNKVERTLKCQESQSEKKESSTEARLLEGLEVKLTAPIVELRKGQASPGVVLIENNSGEDIDGPYSWSIELVRKSQSEDERTRETYESLLSVKELLEGADKTCQKAVLEKNSVVELNFDLTKLLWRRAISASDVSQDPFLVIPPGMYQLRVVMLIDSKKQNGEAFTKELLSNETSIFVYTDNLPVND